MRRGVLVGVLAAVVGFTGVIAPVTATAASDIPRIENLVVDAGPFTVDGLTGSATARVRVDIITGGWLSESCEGPLYDIPGQSVTLERTSGGPRERVWVDLHWVSGDSTGGTYEGEWRIGSTRNGVWTVTRVSWCRYEFDGVDPRVAPGVTRTITVVGTNPPKVTLVRRIPAVVRVNEPQDFLYAFTDAAGRPLAGRGIVVLSPGSDPRRGGGWIRTTNQDGRVLVRVTDRVNQDDSFRTLILATPPSLFQDQRTELLRVYTIKRERYTWVSATPSAGVIPRGGSVTVAGSVAPVRYSYIEGVGVRVSSRVALLRRDGSRWTTVSTAAVRGSGRYTLKAPGTFAARGPHYYRVVASGGGLVPTTSRTFLLTGR